jgi:NitT/TauT family transport system substrate-binding protein
MLCKYIIKKQISVFFMFMVLLVLPNISHGRDTIRFGVLPVLDTLPLFVGREYGFFEKNSIDLEIISFQSALERDAALCAGKLGGYFGDILNTVLLIHSNQKIKIITTAFHTNPEYRMFGLAASPGSKPKDLKWLYGKRIAISRCTIIEYLLDKILADKGISPDLVEKQEIKKIPIRLQMLLADKVPVALLPEPLLTLAESKNAKILTDDSALDTTLTVLALQTEVIKKNNSLRHRFIKAYSAAVEKINQDPEAYKGLLLKHTRFPASIKNMYQIPVFPEVKPPLEKDIMDTQKWLIKKNMAGSMIPFDDIVFK